MPTLPILYASHDGHTRKITDYLADKLKAHDLTPEIFDLGAGQPDTETLQTAPAIVIAAAIRYGKPLPPAEAFIREHKDVIANRPLVLLSINLTARKPGKTTPEGSVYVRKWIKRHKLSPAIAAGIAGKLDYGRYGPFDKFMIRLIMKITGGPTDPSACVEFTNWEQVEDLAGQIAAIAQPEQEAETA